MTTLDRRAFVSRSALTAGSWLALPPWLASGFGLQEPAVRPPAVQRPTRLEQLAEAARRARDQGKPLLVLAVPDRGEKWTLHGEWLGAWIDRGWPEHRLALARCVIACADAAEFSELVRAPREKALPLMWVVDARRYGDSEGALPRRAVALELRHLSAWVDLRAETAEGLQAQEERFMHAELNRLTQALESALSLFGADAGALSDMAREKLTEEQRRRIDAWLLEGGEAPIALRLRAAAVVAQAAHPLTPQMRAAREAVLSAFDAEYGSKRVPGSVWAQPAACGFEVVDPETPEERALGAVLCGIAYGNDKARRFLCFYVQASEKR